MAEEKHSFLTSLPGILSGLAALVTAGVGGYALISKSQEAPTPSNEAVSDAELAPPAEPQPTPAAPTEPSVQPEPVAGGPFSVTAVLDDPDGYVNVRSNASAQSRIVAVVRLNETVRTHPQAGAWWLVRTRSGSQGYVHASRIRMIDG